MVPLPHLRQSGSSRTSIAPHLLPYVTPSPRVHWRGSPDPDHAPGILPVKGLVEVEHVAEFITRIRWLADEQAEIHEREHDVTQIRGGDHTPVFEHKAGHHTKALEGEVAACFGQFAPGNVTTLGQSGLAEFQSGEHKEIRAFIEARLASPNAVHDSIAKTQLRQRELSLSPGSWCRQRAPPANSGQR